MHQPKFIGTIPAFYDHYLGPTLFEPYAEDLSNRVALAAAEGPILETACGTGRLTRHLRSKISNSTRLIATDLNEPMLNIAREKHGSLFGVEFQQADATSLPFPDSTFGAVVNQFGMMFMPDKQIAVREAARVLKRGGMLAFNVWDSLQENPPCKAAFEISNRFLPSDVLNYLQLPFAFHAFEMWTTHLQNNGFSQITIHKLPLELKSERAEDLAIGLICGTPLHAAFQDCNIPTEPVVSELTKAYITEGGDRPFVSRMQAIVIAARKL